MLGIIITIAIAVVCSICACILVNRCNNEGRIRDREIYGQYIHTGMR